MLVGGAILGAINGSLVTLARIPPFIATLGEAAFRSLIQMKADGASINASSSVMTDYLDSGITLSFLKVGATADRAGAPLIPWGVTLFAVAVLFFWLLSSRTTLGVYVRGGGDNELATRYSAVKVGWVRFSTYVMCGICCGVGAAILAQLCCQQCGRSIARTGCHCRRRHRRHVRRQHPHPRHLVRRAAVGRGRQHAQPHRRGHVRKASSTASSSGQYS